jgi:hypothetical protein
MVIPIILRGALYQVAAHHSQRVFDSAQRHCLPRVVRTGRPAYDVKLSESTSPVVNSRSFFGEFGVVFANVDHDWLAPSPAARRLPMQRGRLKADRDLKDTWPHRQ